MPESTDSNQHVKPFVYESLTDKSLYFSISAIQSRMSVLAPDVLELAYTKTMMAFLLFNHRPDLIAMIGLGGGSLAKFCYRHLRKSLINVVEINPHVIALRDEFHVPRDDQRFTVIRGDGAHYVRHPPARLDVLLVDGFDREGLPSRLCSQRFYDDCFNALQPNGLMVANLHYGHQHFNVYVDRIQRAFGESTLVMVDEDASNGVVFACKGDLLGRLRPGVLRSPPGLGQDAWGQIMPACASVMSALKARRE